MVSGLGSKAITSASSRASNISSIVLFQWSGVFLNPRARVPSWKPGTFPMAPAIGDPRCPLGGAIPGGSGYWRSRVPLGCLVREIMQARPGSFSEAGPFLMAPDIGGPRCPLGVPFGGRYRVARVSTRKPRAFLIAQGSGVPGGPLGVLSGAGMQGRAGRFSESRAIPGYLSDSGGRRRIGYPVRGRSAKSCGPLLGTGAIWDNGGPRCLVPGKACWAGGPFPWP